LSAPQDAWAKPLALELVNLFRETEITFVRQESQTYNPETGQVEAAQLRIKCGAAVESVSISEEGGTNETHTATLWFDSNTLPTAPNTADVVEYKNRIWRIVSIDPLLGSGDTNYAYKLTVQT
jgi:hypothetical protein